MNAKSILIFAALLSFACNNNAGPVTGNLKTPDTNSADDENPFSSVNKIPLPTGFKREVTDSTSFAFYLRNIGLKKTTTVYLFNGLPKINQSAQYALLNISVGDKDLQQCADAVMRLRAEYLFAQKEFDKIIFFDNEHTAYQFFPPYTKINFTTYLNRVFGMCGTASLAKQLKPVPGFSAIQPGDVLIRGGFPGHAVIVIDVAVNTAGEKIYLLAQSYMPAQDIHVLKNPVDKDLSPWYEVNGNHIIQTPQYDFTRNELKTW